MKIIEIASGPPRILPIEHADLPWIEKAIVSAFTGKGMSDESLIEYVLISTEWGISRKLVLGDETIGVYLLSARYPITDIVPPEKSHEDLSQYASKRGVEGIALLIDPKYRGRGYGELLKNLPRQMGFDYVWGQQLHSLGNLQQWLKRRRLVADLGNVWVTLEDLK